MNPASADLATTIQSAGNAAGRLSSSKAAAGLSGGDCPNSKFQQRTLPSIFANSGQVRQISYNTWSPAGQVAKYENVCKFTLLNYNAGTRLPWQRYARTSIKATTHRD
jgi:hypothetical protein